MTDVYARNINPQISLGAYSCYHVVDRNRRVESDVQVDTTYKVGRERRERENSSKWIYEGEQALN